MYDIPNAYKITELARRYDTETQMRQSREQRKLRISRTRDGIRRTGFGQNKERAEDLKRSMARYQEKSDDRENLFAIIMPPGCGKTALARRWGHVDVDELISNAEHDAYAETRMRIALGGKEWYEHNQQWFKRLNLSLDLLDYSRPVILFCHTEETALEVGAKPIGCFTLTPSAHMANMTQVNKSRSKEEIAVALDCVRRCKPSDDVPNVQTFKSNWELEAFFLDLMNISGLPTGAPFKYRETYWNDSYARDVPSWVLRGERAGDKTLNINALRIMFEEGRVPKECVDYYVKQSYVPTQFDFGVTMFEWSQALGQLPAEYNEPQFFNPGDDMYKVFPPASPKEVTRANLKVQTMINTFDIFSHPECYDIASYHVGEGHTFVTELLSNWKSVIEHTTVGHMVLPWYRVGRRGWAKKMKNIHALIRCSRHFMNTPITEKDRQALMYMDLLIGRNEYTVDELSEVRARQSDTYGTKHLSFDSALNKYTNGQYKRDFYKAVQEAHCRIKTSPRKINVDSFLDFYKRRNTWITKGGLVYNKLPPKMKTFFASGYDAIHETILEIKGRHNKKSLFEMNDLAHVLLGANEHNFNLTKTQLKYEVGDKDRTLLPGTLAHFIVFTYVLHLAEQQEQIGSVRLNHNSDVDIAYFDKKMSTGFYHALYDWADFNEQHSAWEMGLVIEYLGQIMPVTNDVGMFVDAIVAGMYNMGLQDREGHIHKIWRGLYSGWRGTTWVNSVLNFCYINVALMNVERLTGVDCVVMVDHGGDDLDLMLSDSHIMPQFLEIMDSMLFNANKWKQMFGNRSEFFRNTICEGVAYASPTRALAAFIAGDWEGSGRATVKERVIGLLDQIGKMRRRGVSEEFCQGATMATVSHWCKIKDGEDWLSLPPEILHGRTEDGGLGVPDRFNEVWVLRDKVPEVNDEWYKMVVPDYKVSRDYVEVLSKEVEKFSIVIERQEQLARKLAEDSYDVEKSIDYSGWKQLLNFSSDIERKVPAVEPHVDNVVFETFLDFEVDEDMEGKYASASRYQEFISYLSFNDRAISPEELVAVMSDGEISLEACEFQGDMYYARLVPEFISYRATLFCKSLINAEIQDTGQAKVTYRTICWMAKGVFGHMM